jgi:biopolymer transport protein ExbD
VSLAPLIDVVFILLVFFMLASSFADWRSIRLTSVEAGGAAAPGMVGAMLVEVGRDGFRLSGRPMPPDALAARLAARIDAHPDTRVLVRPGAGVAMQRVVELLDRLAAAGVTRADLIWGARR